MLRFIFLSGIAAILLSACVATSYRPYEGATPEIGTGASRTTVDGVDIWSDGTPPRRFIVIGIIDDKRSAGLIDEISFEIDIAKKVKEVGGDAAILAAKSESIRGYISTSSGVATVTKQGNAQGVSSGVAIPAKDVFTKVKVIKYLE